MKKSLLEKINLEVNAIIISKSIEIEILSVGHFQSLPSKTECSTVVYYKTAISIKMARYSISCNWNNRLGLKYKLF